jgi:type I restriction enzyme R subunit
MSTTFTEADYENSIIELFENMGYRHVYGPDVERDYYSPLI